MSNYPRTLPFVLAATDHGPLIVSRLDFAQDPYGNLFGVGAQLLGAGAYDPEEVQLAIELLEERRETHGDGVVVVDVGANVGVHAVTWATHLTGWGEVIAIEPQERLFYALAGNLALANAFNARAIWAAVGREKGRLEIPRLDYTRAGSYGSLELKFDERVEFIGQAVSYEAADLDSVLQVAIDDFELPRLDLLKIDVERMELEVLAGATRTLDRCRPVLIVEHIKTTAGALGEALAPHGYRFETQAMNVIGRPL